MNDDLWRKLDPPAIRTDGEIGEVPHDRWPHCRAIWDCKIGNPVAAEGTRQCPGCGYELGKEMRLMPDNDKCPHCEEGKLSKDNSTYEECGFTTDPGIVAWE